jgi:hypothetical protein
MTGLLHRLAARALGQARAVRSDARLPFGTIPPSSDDEGNESERPLIAGDDQPSVPNRSPSSLRADKGALTDAHAETPPLLQTRAPGATLPAAPAAFPPVQRQQPTDQDWVGHHPVRDAESTVGPLRGNAVIPGTKPISHKSPPGAVNLETATASNRRVDVSPRYGLDHPSAWMRSEPPVLMAAAAIHTAPVRRPADTASPSHPVSDSEPNEVHVHIGRIEITAVHQAAPRRRAQTAPPASPMTLDAYLAKRGRT